MGKTVKIVIGAGYGDEGKGLTTDYLVSNSPKPIVIRFNGGHQAGHTVRLDDKQHTFANFGSGTFRGAPTYWSQYCTVDPVGLYNEYRVLGELGVTPKLFINADCPVVTPYDKIKNIRDEQENQHGSCGVGFGTTLQREEGHFHLKAMDLMFPKVLKQKLKLIREYYGYQYDEMEREFLEMAADCVLNPNMMITNTINREEYDTFIFEGAQGLLLDQEIGFFPNVTRSYTSRKNVYKVMRDLYLNYEEELYYVTRAYQTRHGNGFMTNENVMIQVNNEDETNKTNKYQGEFRIAPFDGELFGYAITKDQVINGPMVANLVITCLDQVAENVTYIVKDGELVTTPTEDFIKALNHNFIKEVYVSTSPMAKNVVKVSEREFA